MSETTQPLAAATVPAMPAATLIVFRRDPRGVDRQAASQILLIERSARLAFAGGATVFPGGKVDAADLALAHQVLAGSGGGHDPEEAAARIAAIRETLEETGLAVGVKGTVTPASAHAARAALAGGRSLADVLTGQGWTLDLEALVPFARWRPESGASRVFDTRFYLADLGTGHIALDADARETDRVFWLSAREALDHADAGAITLIFPTRRNLERLAQWPDFAACRAHAVATPVTVISPAVVDRDGEPWLMIPSGLGYPVQGEPLAGVWRG